jgi:hypothetical protein
LTGRSVLTSGSQYMIIEKRCHAMWARHRVKATLLALNLKSTDVIQELVAKYTSRPIYFACRFLIRPCFAHIAEFAPPGALFCLSHFCLPSKHAEWIFDHPRRAQILGFTEIQSMFSEETGWSVVYEKIVKDSDHGRTMLQFIASRAMVGL